MDAKHRSRIARPTLLMACAGWFSTGLTTFVTAFLVASMPFSLWVLLVAGLMAFNICRFASFALAMTARFRAGLPPTDT